MIPVLKHKSSVIRMCLKRELLSGVLLVVHEADIKAHVPSVSSELDPSILSVWHLEHC